MDLQNLPPEPMSGETEESKQTGIRWRQLRKLGSTLFPSSSPLGKPTTFIGSTNYLFVGTYSADVVIFDYNQELLMQLSARSATEEMLGVVTSLGITPDESHLVVGFGLGAVGLWELHVKSKSAKLVSLVHSSEHGTVNGNGINKYATNDTHVKGVPVICCGVLKIGGVKTFVSVDASGVVIRHKFKRIMLEYSTKSVRLLGDPSKSRSILDCALQDDVLALLTTKLLLIVQLGKSSTDELFRTILKIPRSSDTAAAHIEISHGCVSLLSVPSSALPLALYSWNNDVKLLDLNMKLAMSAYRHHKSIEYLDFLSKDLAALASDREIHVLNFMGESPYADLKLSDLQRNHLVLSSPAPRIVKMKVLFQSIFILGPYDFQVGQLANWADQLLGLLNAGDPARAIQLALDLYYHTGDLSIIGLPAKPREKQLVISHALPELVLTALKFSIQFDQDNLDKMMPQALRAVALIDTGLLDPIAELVEGHPQSSQVFYDNLATLVRHKTLSKLPPNVLKQLITRNPDPVLFYSLDLSTLDLDLAFHLCEMYAPALNDVKIFLEVETLHDYLAPLRNKENSDKVIFEYLTLILSSRIYPTKREFSSREDANKAKEELYNALFFQEQPFYSQLIERNEKSFFDMLNSSFEDSWLNDNSEFNRQIIVSFLVVHVSLESPYFCSFIARNCSKYPQYLAVSESVLQKVLQTLCEKDSDPDSAQLDILSLLGSYKPRDSAKLIKQLADARYTTVLKHLLGRSKKYLELAEIELSINEPTVWETLDQSFINDRSGTYLFVQTQFDRLAEIDKAKLGSLVAKHHIDDIWDNKNIDLTFLRSMFQEISKSGGQLPPAAVRSRFVTLLAEQGTSEELISTLKTIFTGSRDVEVPMVVDSLLSNNHVDALTILLRRLGRNSEALIYVHNHIRESPLSESELKNYVDIAVDICRDEPDTEVSTEMWKQVLETLAGQHLNEQVRYVTRQIAESTSISLPEIIKHLLNKELDTKDLGGLVHEAYSDLAQKLRTWQCFYEIAQKDNLTELLELVKSRKEGWIVSIDGECEVCGKKIVGLGVDAQKVYKEWEELMKRIPTDKSNADDRLLLFQCMHSYHYGCLTRMSSTGYCIVCYPQ